ncbi:MAG: hypothetical protein ACI97X_000723 [Oceanospirillaceae bacterium]|jgi:hypothetical protein
MTDQSGRMKLQMLILLLFVAASGFAQEVILCERFTNTGQPKNVVTEIVVDSLPLQLKVLYNNGKTTIDKSKLNMLIEVEDGKKIPAQAFYINVSQGRNWVGADIEFKHAAEHVVSAFTPENEILASTNFKITLKGDQKLVIEEKKVAEEVVSETVEPKIIEDVEIAEVAEKEPDVEETIDTVLEETATGFDPTKKVAITEEEAKTLHYEGVSLEFGTSKGGKGLEGKSADFKLTKGRADVTGLLMNQLPIKTKTLQIDIWKKGKDGTFSELTVSKEHHCNPKVYKTFFPVKFYQEGKYKVSVYTDDFVWICSSYLTITK